MSGTSDVKTIAKLEISNAPNETQLRWVESNPAAPGNLCPDHWPLENGQWADRYTLEDSGQWSIRFTNGNPISKQCHGANRVDARLFAGEKRGTQCIYEMDGTLVRGPRGGSFDRYPPDGEDGDWHLRLVLEHYFLEVRIAQNDPELCPPAN